VTRYPRTCRNGHEIAGPDDELLILRAPSRSGHGRRELFPTCRACRAATLRRVNARRISSGEHAERQARLRRARADAADGAAPAGKLRRITRPGDETKTKPADT
jgi:hypothetical protein